MIAALPVVVSFVLAMAQEKTVQVTDPAAGVSFSFPARFSITEQSRDTSYCTWFLVLRSGAEEIRIGLTGNSLVEAAANENFRMSGTQWSSEGKPARMVAATRYTALEGEETERNGRRRSVTVAFFERRGACSAIMTTTSAEARKPLYAIAESFRFTR